MYLMILCTALLSTTTAIVQKNQYQNSTYRGLKAHRVIAAWDEAQEICRSEGGYLASPISADLLDDMQYLMDANRHYNTYLIGTRASQVPGKYVSVEGIALEDMPVLHMLERLDPHQGDCLSMDGDTISVVPCWITMPFMCRSNNTILNNTILSNTILNETMLNNTILPNIPSQNTTLLGCSTEGYQYVPSTEKCYKFHAEWSTWDEAEAKCVAEGGHLVVINDTQEAETIHKLYPTRGLRTLIGLRDRSDGSYDWRSIDGTPVEQLYNVWDLERGRESRVRDNKCGYFSTSGELESFACNYAYPSICEKHPE